MAIVEVRYRFDTGMDGAGETEAGAIVAVEPAVRPDITVTAVRSVPGLVTWSATDSTGRKVRVEMPVLDLDGITADLSVPAFLAEDGLADA
jgi:hypothetical protein